MKCNLIVPGFAKSGTSSLHKYLDMHPEICMSRVKEPHFFSRNDIYANGAKWHDELFLETDATQFLGESSTTYSLDKQPLMRIKKDLKDPKIIILLRDPIERLLSHYKWMWALNLEHRPILQAVIEEEENGYDAHIHIRGCYPAYKRASNYSHIVPMIIDLFGENNVLLLNTQDLLLKPVDCMSKCFRFLGIREMAIKETMAENQTQDKLFQRTLGLTSVARFIPADIKEKNIYVRFRAILTNLLGKRARQTPIITPKEVHQIKNILSEDAQYFQNIFPATKST